MKHHALFVIFEKAANIAIVVCCKLQVTLNLRVKMTPSCYVASTLKNKNAKFNDRRKLIHYLCEDGIAKSVPRDHR